MVVLGLIPARGGSKGIHRKNIKLFDGQPLISWTIKSALNSKCIERVVVSTEDSEIADISLEFGAEVPFIRPGRLAEDTTPGIATVFHALDQLPEVTDVILLQPTSPLRTEEDIENIFNYRKQYNCDSILSICHASKHPSWMYELNKDQTISKILNDHKKKVRQELKPAYLINGAIYIASREFINRYKTFINEFTFGFIMPIERSVDIDTNYDWFIAECLKKKVNE